MTARIDASALQAHVDEIVGRPRPPATLAPAPLIAYTATRYRCPHCRTSYAVKGTAERHLVRCWRNPERKACLTCKHRTYDDWGTPECAIGEGAWPCCNECGSSRLDENGREFCGHYAAEARYLQVLCPAWEAKP